MAIFIGHVGNGFHFKTVLCTHFAQQVDIAAALVAVAEIGAHQEPARIQSPHQQLLDEGLGRHIGQLLVKAFERQLFDAVVRERPDFVAQAADLRRNELGPLSTGGKIGPRVRREGHYGRRPAAFGRQRVDAGEYGLMASVHTVEIADCHRAGAVGIEARQGTINF